MDNTTNDLIWTKEYKTEYFKQYHIDHRDIMNQNARQWYLDHKDDAERIEKLRVYRRRYKIKHKREPIKRKIKIKKIQIKKKIERKIPERTVIVVKRTKLTKEEYREKERQYRKAHRKRLGLRLKEKLIMIVEGNIECRWCPETDIRKLSFDHINGNGDEDRNRFLSSGGNFVVMRWKKYMIKHYHEEKDRYQLQVLCRNCHELKSLENGDYIQNRYRKRPEENLITLTNFI